MGIFNFKAFYSNKAQTELETHRAVSSVRQAHILNTIENMYNLLEDLQIDTNQC